MEESNYYLEKAPIFKAIANLSIPLMLGMSMTVIYNIIDTYFIGRLHNFDMIAAVSLTIPVFAVLMSLGSLLGVGGGTYLSRLLGEKNHEKVKNVSAFSFYMSLVFGVICIIVGFLFLNHIVFGLGSTVGTFKYTKIYLEVLLLGSPFIILNSSLDQIIRAEGAAKVSMNGMILSCILNIILDPILILYFNLNVLGAGLGTVIANIVAISYYIYYIKKSKSNISISIKYLKVDKEMLSNIFKTGIPACMFGLFLILSSLLLNNFAKLYGSSALAAFAIQGE